MKDPEQNPQKGSAVAERHMQIEVGTILEGKVTGIKPFGAFVALAPDYKVSGLVHISQVSNTYIEKIEDKLKEGDIVKVKVLEVVENPADPGKPKISLSMKALEENTLKKPRRETKTEWKEKPAQRPVADKSAPPVFTAYARPPKKEPTEPKDPFEEMMSRFKASSDEKISDLRKNVDNHRGGGGYSRKGNKKF